MSGYFQLLNSEHNAEDGVTTTTVHATPLTESPWGPGFQHGSPPAALVAALLEGGAQQAGLTADQGRFVRMTCEILGPVPMGDLHCVTQVTRPGKRISLWNTVVSDPEGKEFIRGSGWWIRGGDTAEIDRAIAEPLPGPEEGRDAREFVERWSSGYIDSIEVRRVDVPGRAPAAEDGSYEGAPHPYGYWARSPHTVIEGVEDSPWVQLMKTVDIANGLNTVLDPKEWLFMNVDLSVYLHQLPRSSWTGILADVSYGSDGLGLTHSRLYDEQGPIGTINQGILMQRQG